LIPNPAKARQVMVRIKAGFVPLASCKRKVSIPNPAKAGQVMVRLKDKGKRIYISKDQFQFQILLKLDKLWCD